MSRSGIAVWSTGFALLVAAAGAAAGDWTVIRNPAELRSLFSNTTFRYESGFHGFTAQFRSDGTGVWREIRAKGNKLVTGDPLPRKWEVKGRDQVCITSLDTAAVHCYSFERNRKRRSELTMTDVGSKFVVTITVEDGI